MLEKCCSPEELNHGAADCAGANSGEVLLRRVSLVADNWRIATNNLERLQKEFAVFKKAYADSNRMLERKIEEISLLRLVIDASSHAIPNEDPLKLILEKVITIAGAESGSIMLKNGMAHNLEVRAATGQESLAPDNPMSGIVEEMAHRVLRSGNPQFVDDIKDDPQLALPSKEARCIGSLASFPLVIENRIIGVLNLTSVFRNAFGAETERIMHIIAGQIAVAVENALLYGEVRKTKEYLENLVERAGDAIFTLDQDHKIVSWNTGAKLIFKQDKQSVLGEPIYDLFPENLLESLRKKIQSVLESESIVTIETDATRGDKQITQIALTLSPIRDAEGEVIGVSGIAKDMTERKQVEEELRRLNEAKSNFVSTVSHELRTPLTSIKSMTEVLLHEMDSLPEDGIRKKLNIINEECDRLSGLISSILDLQKLNAGKLDVKFEQVILADVVRQVTELFAGVALQKRIELNRDLSSPDSMTSVMGNRERLMRILSNLLSNALKCTAAGGNIRVSLLREGENVRLAVIDNGIGIPEEEREKIFEKFYQVDNPTTRKNGGTGLGLAITKELVTLHGGKIWVESEEGNGCNFNVLIPAMK